ncbi:hypothetical protein [Paraburkholderia acidisoli]|uniref:Uncharacterized protein n=1 Tax=Paraburkholderia acidisoli TaxID=2571748 RepID=A0A7Z2GRC3_9BURK|nr:hypothetical protein [Paraburkholderia acidisoli]QGZ66287.1 hypothetical protein FAZ98_31315 [Paraburkholderia acidisoli]QGZ66371.1 hypothetical protein FAZ98_31795 [Paraburkholderia acidisoli]
MTPENFAYWLQGFAELTQGQTPNPAQWKSILEHLDLVFKKMTAPVQTGPEPGTHDPMAGKSVDELLKKYWTGAPSLFSPPYTITCTNGQQADSSILIC